MWVEGGFQESVKFMPDDLIRDSASVCRHLDT
jgi:hypothetical protein